jgi:hypothetical protein
MDTESISQKTGIQPDDQTIMIPPPAPVRKKHYVIYIVAFIFVAVAEAIISYFLFIKKPMQKFSAIIAAPTAAPLPSPTQTPVGCSDPSCLLPFFMACAPSKLTMPFTEGSSFNVMVYGKENDLCRYSLIINDTRTNSQLNFSECRMPMEKMMKDTLGHLFGEDKSPGKETIKAEQDKLENEYCVKKTIASSPTAIPSPQ